MNYQTDELSKAENLFDWEELTNMTNTYEPSNTNEPADTRMPDKGPNTDDCSKTDKLSDFDEFTTTDEYLTQINIGISSSCFLYLFPGRFLQMLLCFAPSVGQVSVPNGAK